MKNKFLILILIILITIASLYTYINSKNLIYTGISNIIISGDNDYKTFPISNSMYNGNINSIRIVDDQNQDIPYFIHSYTDYTSSLDKTFYTSTLNNTLISKDLTTYEFSLVATTTLTATANDIILDTNNSELPENFIVYGSLNNLDWSEIPIKNKELLNNKILLNFNKDLSYKSYKFTFNTPTNNDFKIFDIYFKSKNYADSYSFDYFSKTMPLEFFIEPAEDKKNQTNIIISNEQLTNRYIKQIYLDISDEFFYRDITTNFEYSGNISKAPTKNNDGITNRTSLIINNNSPTSDDLIISIENGDDSPLNIDNIYITYYNDYIIFKDKKNSNYSVTYSQSYDFDKPKYDIVNYRKNILNNDIDLVALSEPELSKVSNDFDLDSIFKNINMSIIYNILLLIVTILIISVILKNLSLKHSE